MHSTSLPSRLLDFTPVALFAHRQHRENVMLEKDVETRRLEKELLEKGLEIKRLEKELMLANENLNRQTLEFAARELDLEKALAKRLSTMKRRKNSRIEVTQSEIEQAAMPGESKPAQSIAMNSADIDALFQTQLLTDMDWFRFQKRFEKVFPGILGQLKIQHPALSTAELRLVLLTKMGLKAKEIAGLLAISLDAIRKLKYRFKKKMGLSEEELLANVDGQSSQFL